MGLKVHSMMNRVEGADMSSLVMWGEVNPG